MFNRRDTKLTVNRETLRALSTGVVCAAEPKSKYCHVLSNRCPRPPSSPRGSCGVCGTPTRGL